MTTATTSELRLERTFDAPAERVFDAWTTAATFARWFGPRSTTVAEHALDARVGGRYRVKLRNTEGGEHEVSGAFTTVDRPKRLAFTWAWTQPDGSRGHEYTIEVALKEAAGRTRMTLVQRPFVDAEQQANHEHGWADSFDKLAEILAAA